jgi:hypothetical protein
MPRVVAATEQCGTLRINGLTESSSVRLADVHHAHYDRHPAHRQLCPTSDMTHRLSAPSLKCLFPVAGAVAGVTSATCFAAVHALFISDIWYAIVPTAVAASVCGACVAASFGILVRDPTVRGWLLYNATFVGLLTLLGIVSLAIYEPVTTIPTLLTLHGPPSWLFERTVPLQIGFTIAATALITPVFGRHWWHIGPVLVTATVLVIVLGLNVSIMGLVEIPRSSAYVVAELVGLILTIVVAYAVVFVVLQWSAGHVLRETLLRFSPQRSDCRVPERNPSALARPSLTDIPNESR